MLPPQPTPCQGKGWWKRSNINPEGGLGTRNWHTRIPRWILTWHKGGRAGSHLPQNTTTKTTQATVTDPSPPFAHLCNRQGCAGCIEGVLTPSPELLLACTRASGPGTDRVHRLRAKHLSPTIQHCQVASRAATYGTNPPLPPSSSVWGAMGYRTAPNQK